jgi:endoglucanase
MSSISRDFLHRLLNAPGPSGFELGPARLWRAEAGQFAEIRVDGGGNSFATVGPRSASRARPSRLMFAGHIDEIGVMVTHIDEDGFLYFETIGGWDPQIFVGQRVVLLGRDGEVPGVIGKSAVHLLKTEDRDKASKVSDLWIDIGAASRAEVQERIRIGDPGVLGSGVLELPNGRLVSRSLDNRTGAFVVLEALRLLAAEPPEIEVTAVATTQEEIGHSGGGARPSASGLDPVAAIVVDVTHATDFPGAEKKRHGEVKLGGGPVLSRGSAVSPVVFDLLVETAEAESIPYVLSAAPRATGTDADAIFTAHRGIPTGLVSVPNRYMHSPNEMVAWGDLEHAARLLAAFARRVTPDSDFVPR